VEASESAQPAESQGADNDFYSSILSDIPEEHRPYVETAVKQFDANVTRKFQDAAEYRKTWEPYEQLGVNDVEPEQMEQLMAFAEIASDPDTFRQWWEAVGDEYGFTDELYDELGGDEEGDEDEDILEQPAMTQALEEILDQRLAPLLEKERERDEQQRVDEASRLVDQQIAKLKEEHGDFDEQMIYKLALAYDGDDAITQAFNDYKDLVSNTERNTLREKSNQPPPSEGPGRADTNAHPVTDWNEAKDAARERIRQANAQ